MKIQGKIMQIITWEERKKFFFCMDFGETEVDLIHLSCTEEKSKWHDRGVFGLIKSFLKIDKPIFDYRNIMFHQHFSRNKEGIRYDGLPILIERPHDFKSNDVVELDIKLSHICNHRRYK